VHIPRVHAHFFEFNFFWAGLTTLAHVDADLVSLDLGSG